MEAVIKDSSYILVHAPNSMKIGGTTQIQARKKDKNSEYLKKLDDHIRSFSDCVSYAPNQCYIGNVSPEELREIDRPWYAEENLLAEKRFGRRGGDYA